jgi:hypothetical protein
MKTPARERAGVSLMAVSAELSPIVAAIIVMAIVVSIIMTAIPITMTAVLPADIMAVNPTMPKARPMAWHPHHFIVAVPVTRAMGVVRPVASFDYNAIRSNSGGNKNTRRNYSDK